MVKFSNKNSARGFTLIEALLALTLSAIILAPLVSAFKMSFASWNDNNERTELFQQMRGAMERMVTELRYANPLVFADATNGLVFDTQVLLDNDELTTETIKYEWDVGNQVLLRYVNGSPAGGEQMAGNRAGQMATVTSVQVIGFNVTPYHYDGSDTFTKLTVPPDLIGDADVVEISLTMSDKDLESYTITTRVKLRND